MSKSRYFVIDLFAGCGGLGEGFSQAGFEIVSQIEMDKWACETLKTRHLYYELKKTNRLYLYQQYFQEKKSREAIFQKFPDLQSLIADRVIQAEFGKVSIEKIIEKIEYAKRQFNTTKVHVVIGGPPCQAYSIVGRARDTEGMKEDKRNFLYEYYLQILERVQPDFFVFENVPGLITAEAKGEEMFSKMIEDFKNISPSYEIAPSFDEYYCNPSKYILNTSKFGVPQRRKRVVFIGYKKIILSKNPNVKKVFQKILSHKQSRFGGYTLSDAIGDLPHLKPGEGSDRWHSSYLNNNFTTPYQKLMRRNSCGIANHRARTHMKSDLERYRFFIEHHLNGNKVATLTDLMRERPDLTPKHNHLDKFLDRFKVQWWSQPVCTVTAHINKDGHYYIHPDVFQCRSFTVREAARCQSFPDNFKFEGPRTEQFRQVGNAVPPLLARVIASYIQKELKIIYE